MGPLVSALAILAFGTLIALFTFWLSAISRKESRRRSPLWSHAVFGLIEAAMFLLGCAFGALLPLPFIGGELISGGAAMAYLALIFATGCVAALVAGRAYWRFIHTTEGS